MAARKPIRPPQDMPLQFVYKNHIFRWFQALPRHRKRRMIRLFQKFPQEISVIAKAIPAGVPEIKGIFIMKWDDRNGPMGLGSYPASFTVDKPTLMQIYANHLAEDEPGLLAIETASNTLISFTSRELADVAIVAITDIGIEPPVLQPVMEKLFSRLVAQLKQENLYDDVQITPAMLRVIFMRVRE